MEHLDGKTAGCTRRSDALRTGWEISRRATRLVTVVEVSGRTDGRMTTGAAAGQWNMSQRRVKSRTLATLHPRRHPPRQPPGCPPGHLPEYLLRCPPRHPPGYPPGRLLRCLPRCLLRLHPQHRAEKLLRRRRPGMNEMKMPPQMMPTRLVHPRHSGVVHLVRGAPLPTTHCNLREV
jgi:hypothetical protein